MVQIFCTENKILLQGKTNDCRVIKQYTNSPYPIQIIIDTVTAFQGIAKLPCAKLEWKRWP